VCICVTQFGEEMLSLCTELCVSVLRRELGRLCQHSGNVADPLHSSCRHFADLDADTAVTLAQICRTLSRLYDRHPQMHLVCVTLNEFPFLLAILHLTNIQRLSVMWPLRRPAARIFLVNSIKWARHVRSRISPSPITEV